MTTNNTGYDNNPKTGYTTPELTLQHAGYEESDFEGPRGSVITIMGIPKGEQETNIDQVMATIVSATSHVFDNIEITHLPNVMLATKEALEKAASKGASNADEEMYNTPEGRVAATLFTHAMVSMDEIEERARNDRWEALTPEQRQAEIEENRKNVERINAEGHASAQKHRTEEVARFFDIAQKWATLPDLSATERCHGVAHDLFLVHGPKHNITEDGQYVDMSNSVRSDDYAKRYNHDFADDIRRRTIKAAKELFGDI